MALGTVNSSDNYDTIGTVERGGRKRMLPDKASITSTSSIREAHAFSEETTFHGIKFIFEDGPFLSRRVIWILLTITAMAAFSYLVTIKVLQYLRYGAQIDLEQTYVGKVKFPKVTICNQNQHRLTSLHNLGMLDVVLNSYEVATGIDLVSKYTQKESGCIEHYEFLPSVCQLPIGPSVLAVYNQLSISVCKHLCSSIQSNRCSGMFFLRPNNTCILTSYTGNDILEGPSSENPISPNPEGHSPTGGHTEGNFPTGGPPEEHLPTSDPTEDYTGYLEAQCTGSSVYLRRKRCTDIISFRCHMEEQCDVLQLSDDKAEEWLHVAGRDNTLTVSQGKGHYIFLVDTSMRPGSVARLQTPFMDTTDKCVMLHYRFFGSFSSLLTVIAVKENAEEVILANRTGYDYRIDTLSFALWRPWLVALPEGVHRVVIDGQRSVQGSTGIGLDDIEIHYCESFGRECKHTLRGTGYLGHQNSTVYGEHCLPWSDPRVINYLLRNGIALPSEDIDTSYNADLSVSSMENYCRNLDGDLDGPWCVTEDMDRERCQVDFCPCQTGWFQCGDGSCIPGEWRCNGVSDCKNREDELVTECQNRAQMSCEFEDIFMCGYSFPDTGNTVWQRQETNRNIAAGNIYSMIVYASNFVHNMGDRALMVSPAHTFESNVKVEFDARIILEEAMDMLSMLEVSLMSKTGVPGRRLWATSHTNAMGGTYKNWATYSVCVPAGDHKLGFLVTWAMDSKVEIDNVKVTDTSCVLSFEDSPIESVICDFDSDECGYNQQSHNAFFEWQRIPLDNVISALQNVGHYGGCSGSFYDIYGTLTSESFPFAYDDDLHCLQTIQQPNGSTTVIEFNAFGLETHMRCGYDSLLLSDGVQEVTWCGESLPPPFVSSQSTITVKFSTDSSVTNSGFQLHYHATTSPEVDYAIAASFRGEKSVLGTLHTKLVSPIGNISEITCLTIDVMVLSSFTLTLVISDDNSNNEQTVPLVTIPGSLGVAWNTFSLDIDPLGVSENHVFFIYETLYQGDEPQYSAIINDVILQPGSCQHKDVYKRGNVSCDFSSKDQCGYLDVSTSPVRWTRIDLNESFAMRVEFTSSLTSSTLLSPEVTVRTDSCLVFSSSLAHGITLAVKTDRLENNTLTHYVSEEPFTGDVALPTGTYRILFTCTGRGLEQLVILHNVHIIEQECQTNGLGPDGYNAERINYGDSESDSNVIEATKSLSLEYRDNSDEVRSRDLKTLEGLVQFYENDDLAEFLMTAVQEREHFIASCKFEGRDCDPEAWVAEFTDLGACYTFNPNIEDPYHTNVTGAENGLQMILNVESYEQVPGLTKDAGIKVYIGTQDDVPLMRDMALAVAPGTHTMAAIGLLTEEFMEPPYGSCGKTDMTYYPTSHYSYNRCLKDCKATALLNKCGCDNVDMNSSSYCQVDDFLNCLVPDFFGSDAVSCDCFGACNAEHYTTQLSYTSLSLLSPETIIPDKVPELKNRFYTALNAQERIVDERFATTVSRLVRLQQHIEEFRDIIEKDFLDQTNSYILVLNKGLRAIADTFQTDAGVFYNDLIPLGDAYQKHHKPTYKALLESLESVMTKLVVVGKVGKMLSFENMGGIGFGPEQIVSKALAAIAVKEASEKVELASALLKTVLRTNGIMNTGPFVHMLEADLFEAQNRGELPLSLVNSKRKQNICSDLGDTLEEHLNESLRYVYEIDNIVAALPAEESSTSSGPSSKPGSASPAATRLDQETLASRIGPGSATPAPNGGVVESTTPPGSRWETGSPFPSDTGWVEGSGSGERMSSSKEMHVLEQLTNYATALTLDYFVLEDCLTEYELFIEATIQQWSRLQEETLTIYKTPDTASIDLTSIETDLSSLSSLITQYKSANMNKYNITNELGDTLKHIQTSIGTVLSELDTAIVQPEIAALERRRHQFETYYGNLFKEMVDYGGYYPNKAVTLKDQITHMSIWRAPYANIRKEDIRLFRKSVLDGVRSVPQNTVMFINTTGPELAKSYVRSYFNDLQGYFSNTYQSVNALAELIQTDIMGINAEMTQFLASGEINEKFISQNYLQLDIFYGLLKQDTIRQIKEYDLATFFSDFGGYMGLLLGGSVISLVEIFDWLIFNTALKRRNASLRRNPDDNLKVINHMGRQPAIGNTAFTEFEDPSVRVKNYNINYNIHQPGRLPRFGGFKHFSSRPGEEGYKPRKPNMDNADDFYMSY